MTYNLINDLRNGNTMPSEDDKAFFWYAEITDKAAGKIKQLEQQLDTANELICAYCEQSAQQQSRILELREVLEYKHDAVESLMNWCVKNVNKWDFPQWDTLSNAGDVMHNALATPDDDTALRKLVAKHIRTMGEWYGKHEIVIYANKIEDGSAPL